MTLNIISGNDSANTLAGGAGDDLIYGFDPNAAYPSANISATRVASGLSQPLFAAAPPGDTGRLFIVEKTGAIKILDLNTGSVLGTPFLTVSVDIENERGLLGLAFDPDYREQWLFLHLSHGDDASHAQRGRALSGLEQSQCRERGEPANGHRSRQPVERPQPQCRMDRLRTRQRSLYRDRRQRQPRQRPDAEQPARQDPAHRRRAAACRTRYHPTILLSARPARGRKSLP